MSKYILKLDREVCQSNFVCTAVDPRDFEEEDSGKYEGKVRLKDEPKDEKDHEIELSEDERGEGEQAANGCPVFAIELIDKETGETIAP
jgi:ferredoxin